MQKQKRGFWLFIFSLIPGAGEMYMGFKKQGISIMFLFWGVFAIGACTGMDWLVFLIPIIWFYSFFNVHNLKSLSEEEFYSIEDSYVLHMDELAGDISSLLKHHGKITAILLIFLGASILWNTLVDFLYMILPGYLADVIGRFTYHLPQLVIAVAIIFAGIYILTRKKDALDDEQPDSFTEEEHYWTPYRPYQQNVPNMATDAVKNTTDTVNPDCCTDIDVTDTANNKSPVSLKKDSAAGVSQEDASSQTTLNHDTKWDCHIKESTFMQQSHSYYSYMDTETSPKDNIVSCPSSSRTFSRPSLHISNANACLEEVPSVIVI